MFNRSNTSPVTAHAVLRHPSQHQTHPASAGTTGGRSGVSLRPYYFLIPITVEPCVEAAARMLVRSPVGLMGWA